MDITHIEIEQGEELLVLQLSKEVAEKYQNILKTRNLTHAEFFNEALYFLETFTLKTK